MITSAKVNIEIANNVTWEDAFKFGTDGDTTWSFTGQSFIMELKADRDDTTALFTLSTANGRIVVDDVVQRILHFNVTDTDIQSSLPAYTEYQYDLVMFDTSVPPIRVALMHGEVKVKQGVTES